MNNLENLIESLNNTTEAVNKALSVLRTTSDALGVAMELEADKLYQKEKSPFTSLKKFEEPYSHSIKVDSLIEPDPLAIKSIKEFEAIEKAADTIIEKINKTPLDNNMPVQICSIDMTFDETNNIPAIMKRVQEKLTKELNNNTPERESNDPFDFENIDE